MTAEVAGEVTAGATSVESRQASSASDDSADALDTRFPQLAAVDHGTYDEQIVAYRDVLGTLSHELDALKADTEQQGSQHATPARPAAANSSAAFPHHGKKHRR